MRLFPASLRERGKRNRLARGSMRSTCGEPGERLDLPVQQKEDDADVMRGQLRPYARGVPVVLVSCSWSATTFRGRTIDRETGNRETGEYTKRYTPENSLNMMKRPVHRAEKNGIEDVPVDVANLRHR